MVALEIVNWERGLVDEIQPLTPEVQAAKANIGFLLVGHGTRRVAGQAQLREVFVQFEQLMTPAISRFAFLELADPDIPTAIEELSKSGIDKLITVPVLLFSAGHAQQDIPKAVESACRSHGLECLSQTEPFESADAIQELSARRFREAVCGQECLTTGSCSGQYCSQTSLTMIGRGSSSDSATEKMRAFTRRRISKTRVHSHETAFIHAQTPDVSTALAAMRNQQQALKVVQPHLLFEGQLMDDLRDQVDRQQEHDADSRWIITQPLGADAKLSNALAELARSTASAELSRLETQQAQ